jgi:indole-3-glycerol phosphate synthase
MPTILDAIIEQKRLEVRQLRKRRSEFGPRTVPRRPFITAVDRRPKLSLIAEIKRASPSKGLICEQLDPAAIAARYEKAGASAISVLTDERFFKGSVDFLPAAREACLLPVLRKDFIIDPIQVLQTAHIGADALLLIAAALSGAQLEELNSCARELEIEVLIEIHNASELDRVMRLAPRLVGINNRDLTTFEVKLETALHLAPQIPAPVAVVAESGICSGGDTLLLQNARVSAVLVGEALMRLEDPAPLIRELLHASTN